MTDDKTEENAETHSLPTWRQIEIAEKVASRFIGTLQCGCEDVLPRAMEDLGIIAIPYSEIPARNKDMGKLFSEYGFVFRNMEGLRPFYYNMEQSPQEFSKTSWHEVGHVDLGHKQTSRLAEAEANFYMECAMLLEANIEKIKEVMPMIFETKSA